MLYAILCYNNEDAVCAWSKEEDEAVMARLGVVQEKLAKARQARPRRPAPSHHRRHHLAQGGEPPLVIDGPYAETKEQFLGF